MNKSQALRGRMGRKLTKKNVGGTAIVVVFLTFSYLSFEPYIKSGFWYDDVANWQTWGLVHRHGITISDFSWRMVVLSLQSGRILGAYAQIYPFFYYIHAPAVVKSIDIGLVLINVALFAWLLRKLGASARLVIAFAMLVVGLQLQIRDFFDPVGSFSTLYPSLGIELSVCMLLLVKWRETGRASWLAASSAIALASTFIYELNVLYFPIALAFIFVERKRIACRRSALWLVAIPMVLVAAIQIAVKCHAVALYTGTAPGSVSMFAMTLAKQLIAGLPGSFYAFRGWWQLPYDQVVSTFLGDPRKWLLAAVTFALAWFSTGEKRAVPRLASFSYVCFGALIFLPAVMVALSSRYQKEVIWGVGYLPVYLQYFGVAFFLARGIELIGTSIVARVSIAIVVAILVPMNVIVNQHTRDILDAGFWNDQVSLASAMRNGLMDSVKDGDIIDTPGLPAWLGGDLIYQIIQKRVVVSGEQTFGFLHVLPSQSPNYFVLQRGNNHGWSLIPADGSRSTAIRD